MIEPNPHALGWGGGGQAGAGFPASSEFSTNKIVQARFWPWLEPLFTQKS
jgi:hypothetical protein